MADDEKPTEPVEVAARRIVEKGMPREVARALGEFRDELAKFSTMDPDEAADHANEYLRHILAVWLPMPMPPEPQEEEEELA